MILREIRIKTGNGDGERAKLGKVSFLTQFKPMNR
jgi:hypothetical protein